MDRNEIRAILDAASGIPEGADDEAAWAALQPLIERVRDDADAAFGVAMALGIEALDLDRRMDLAEQLLATWPDDAGLMGLLGEVSQSLHDIRYLNDPPPDVPFFEQLAQRLRALAADPGDEESEIAVLHGLITASRVCGRSWDDACEAAHHRLIELCPDEWANHYNLGLFFKNRGRWAEGVAANERAVELGGEDEDGVLWNLAICATGAGDGEKARATWARHGLELSIGAAGLPEGRFRAVQVRVAERPLAERGPGEDSPGREETIWIDRLSPCHGRVVSALFEDLGVDHGDLVLHDGAPILIRDWGERGDVPVFPHLATLARSSNTILRFAATQPEAGAVAAISDELGEGTFLYVHTEAMRTLCRTCWEQHDPAHDHVDETHRVVTGKLVFPGDRDTAAVARALDAATTADERLRVYVPELWRDLDADRAEVERRRFAMLVSAT